MTLLLTINETLQWFLRKGSPVKPGVWSGISVTACWRCSASTAKNSAFLTSCSISSAVLSDHRSDQFCRSDHLSDQFCLFGQFCRPHWSVFWSVMPVWSICRSDHLSGQFCLSDPEALDDLPWKYETRPSSIDSRTLEAFQRQRWGNFWETGWSAYGLFWEHRYHLELSWSTVCHSGYLSDQICRCDKFCRSDHLSG